ncbi:ATP-dependent DNA ligase [Glutamicibacter protophormiae]|uniref:DUF7882 family protein n=1 Tax=Glutamicibacter protophormiae TaxID=37930 RepID=UPI003A8E3FA3
MGKFIYEGTVNVDFEDRLLAHLQIVIGNKLRRSEAFHFSWRDDSSIGDGRTTIWLHAQSSLVYKFYGSRRPQINRAWLEALTLTATPTGGLSVVPEPSFSELEADEVASDEAH